MRLVKGKIKTAVPDSFIFQQSYRLAAQKHGNIRHFPFADLDNFTACLNGYPASSAHSACRAGENAADKEPGLERVRDGNRQTCRR